jgi:hypothetical protein
MAEIVNLRRARKAKARAEAASQADANRTRHGVSTKLRKLDKARTEKDAQAVDAHKLDEGE